MKSFACGLIGSGWFWALRAVETGSFWLAFTSAVSIVIAASIFTAEWPEETR